MLQSLIHSFNVSQVDAEIELAGENEKDQDSKEAETEVSKCQTHVSFHHSINLF